VELSPLTIKPGKPYPLGATPDGGSVHFGLVSRNATGIWLLIFDDPEARQPNFEFYLDPANHRTGDVWHCDIYGLGAGALYLYRVEGPFAPEKGLRFNPHRPVLDPYARALTGSFQWNLRDALGYDKNSEKQDLSLNTHDGAEGFPKCIVMDDTFDWQGDRPLNYPLKDCIIYEGHVKGLSAHPGASAAHGGTYRGVIEMIPYLKELGITSLELLPVHEFDTYEFDRTNPETGEALTNYWGYNTIAFFAPKGAYSSSGALGEQVTEFKEMVRSLHAAGIEVILDVVFNHTGEGNELGPTLSFRGIDNPTYYMLEENRRYYRNFSGTGNTMNCNNPVMRTFITECLHYWVVDMHIDGFRFDLGSILGRDEQGNMLPYAPILERIAEDPILVNTKIIAEAWDAGGAYQVGGFQGRWAEWNDRYRDDVRRFWRGDRGTVAALATRISGSSDLYYAGGRKPFHSINFITSHDGFTLRDLVSYNRKHNVANGEDNRDGHNSNFSFNHGVEGDTDDPEVFRLRQRQMKNYMATLLLSLGTPMITAGDEYGRTQRGNNNAYCQDNEISWNNYELLHTYGELHRFCTRLIEIRKQHPVFTRAEFYTGRDNNKNRRNDIDWFNNLGEPMDWSVSTNALAVYIDGQEVALTHGTHDDDFYIMFNSSAKRLSFVIPDPPEGRCWSRVVDTAAHAPQDIQRDGNQDLEPVSEEMSLVSRSLVMLRSVDGDKK
jgi:glycogen operon protein